MTCPEHKVKLKVMDSCGKNKFTYRRLKCPICKKLFYSKEEFVSEDIGKQSFKYSKKFTKGIKVKCKKW